MDNPEPTLRLISGLPLNNPILSPLWPVMVQATSPINPFVAPTWLSAIFSLRLDANEHLNNLIRITTPLGYNSGADYLSCSAPAELYAPDGEHLGEGYEFIGGNGWKRMYWIQAVPWEVRLPPMLRNLLEGTTVKQPSEEDTTSNTMSAESTAPGTTPLRPLWPNSSNPRPTNDEEIKSGGTPNTTRSRKTSRAVPSSVRRKQSGSGKKERMPSNFLE